MTSTSPASDFDTPQSKAQWHLRIAIATKSISGVKWALERGADPAIFCERHHLAKSLGLFGAGPLQQPATLLHIASQGGAPTEMLRLLLPRSDPLLGDLGTGKTPLMAAADAGHLENLALLLPLSNIHATDRFGRTALSMAAFRSGNQDEDERMACVMALIQAGANPNHADHEGRSVLSLASWRRAPESLAVLLPLCDANQLDKKGLSPLAHAILHDREEHALAMLPFANPLLKDNLGRDAAMLAALRHFPHFLYALHAQCPESFERGPGAPTLLMIAASARSAPNIRALLPLSDPKAVCADGADALMIAIERCVDPESTACALLLLPHADLSLVDELGESALSKARARGLTDLADAIQTRMMGSSLAKPAGAQSSRARSSP